MTRLILYIYEKLKSSKLLRWGSFAVLTAVLGILLTRQSYNEDISDFLPLNHEQQKTFQEYQNNANVRRIYVIFKAPDNLGQVAIDRFCEILDEKDTSQLFNYMTADDPVVMQEAMDALYSRIPYLLNADDYARIDTLLAQPDYISNQLEKEKQLLILPTAGFMALQIQHDPLNLFLPIIEKMRPSMSHHHTMLFVDSPFGASETENNSMLVAMLQQICNNVSSEYPEVEIHMTGGPVIAVGNAKQIKTDSVISVCIAVVLILMLLWLTFRNIFNMLLIAFSIGWGWLFAMGCLTLIHNNVSIIVIGISSVILGIAVNYPLHLIAHLSHAANMRSALREIVMPLVVGNITTVGAFLALLPLESVALRDLGLFSAFLLIGTIGFVLVWLPHMVKTQPKKRQSIFDRIGNLQLESKRWLVLAVSILTVILGYYSLRTSFDADLRNINYMTDEQRSDMEYLEQVLNLTEKNSDLGQWNEWRKSKGIELCHQLREAGLSAGFSDDSFNPFFRLVSMEPVIEEQNLAASLVNNLSDNFNYIGWACGLIVFFFLWFSLGSIELALLSFLPMAVSWVWILGIMALMNIQFNVVNIILATFIFGQGDDYTIFMTEGCQYEYAYRRKMLSSFKSSIIISALIMFVGIGALIIARHPALFSLAEVTIIGMFSVVLMAYLFPPLIFRWLVYDHGKERYRPMSIRNLLNRRNCGTIALVSDCYRYRGIDISSAVNRKLRKYSKHGLFHSMTEQIFPTTRTVVLINGEWGEIGLYCALKKPTVNFISFDNDAEKLCVAKNVADQRVSNLSYLHEKEMETFLKGIAIEDTQVMLLEPSIDQIEKFAHLNPIIIK